MHPLVHVQCDFGQLRSDPVVEDGGDTQVHLVPASGLLLELLLVPGVGDLGHLLNHVGHVVLGGLEVASCSRGVCTDQE